MIQHDRHPPSLGEHSADSEALRLQAALISLCGLTEEQLIEVARLSQQDDLNFIGAAVRLRYITRDDVQRAQKQIDGGRAMARQLPDFAALARRSCRPQDTSGDEIRALRTEILVRHRQRGGPNVIAVLSPCSNEGRSHLAAELAGSFAQLGQPTLLVDADLRRPSQHLLYAQDNQQGLADAIAKDEDAHLHPVAPGDLMLITAGRSDSNPVELLSSDRFERLLGRWTERFDHIIFDSPPASEYPDAYALATIAGRILPISRAQHTPMSASREMLRRLEGTRAETVGAVLGHF